MSRHAREVYFQCQDVESNVATFPRLTTRKKNFLSIEKLPALDLLLPKLAQGLSCYLSFATATTEPRNLQHKCIKIKTNKSKPRKIKKKKTEDHNNLKAWVTSQVALCLPSLARTKLCPSNWCLLSRPKRIHKLIGIITEGQLS